VSRVVSIIDESASLAHGACTLAWGEVSLVEKVTGYKKIKFHTHENAGYGDVRLPDMQMHTTSFWLTVPPAVFTDLGRATAIDALGGVGRALETVATIALMCEPRDIGQALGDKGPGTASSAVNGVQAPSMHFDPTLFLFDHVPGGVGLAERIFEMGLELLLRTRSMVAACVCEQGCPGCVGPQSANLPLSPPAFGRKQAALLMLGSVLRG